MIQKKTDWSLKTMISSNNYVLICENENSGYDSSFITYLLPIFRVKSRSVSPEKSTKHEDPATKR